MEPIIVTVDRIVKETNDSKSFYLSYNDGSFPAYKAGQFITLILKMGGKEIRRSYSFGSAPGVDALPFITIKRVENGAVSRYLLQYLKEGDTLKILPPAGRFTIEATGNEHLFLVAAGSGIVPVFSLLKQVLFHQPEKKVVLLYQNYNEASSIYRNNILELCNQFKDRFQLIELFSNPFESEHIPKRLNNYLLEKIIKEEATDSNIHFYLCGPPTFMRMVDFTLRVNGVKDECIKKETFVVGYIPKAPLISDTTPKSVFIHYENKTHTIEVAYPHNILEVALKQGIQLPFSCKGGRCSVCSATCVKGKVVMSINEVLTDKDLQNGLILTCVGYPETDVELVFNHP